MSVERIFKVDVVEPSPRMISLDGKLGPVTFNHLLLSVDEAQELWARLSESLARAKGHITVGEWPGSK